MWSISLASSLRLPASLVALARQHGYRAARDRGSPRDLAPAVSSPRRPAAAWSISQAWAINKFHAGTPQEKPGRPALTK
jgi:hypothetical protein